MRRFDIPEPSLEPPEDRRRAVYSCAICEGEILEGDDYYDIPGLGVCCEECIRDSKCYGAELDDDVDAQVDELRERGL